MEAGFIASIVALPLLVFLMNEDKVPIRAWGFANAYPVKWEVDALNSTKNEVAIEKIELSYTYSYRLV
jgi:phage tail-like protein